MNAGDLGNPVPAGSVLRCHATVSGRRPRRPLDDPAGIVASQARTGTGAVPRRIRGRRKRYQDKCKHPTHGSSSRNRSLLTSRPMRRNHATAGNSLPWSRAFQALSCSRRRFRRRRVLLATTQPPCLPSGKGARPVGRVSAISSTCGPAISSPPPAALNSNPGEQP